MFCNSTTSFCDWRQEGTRHERLADAAQSRLEELQALKDFDARSAHLTHVAELSKAVRELAHAGSNAFFAPTRMLLAAEGDLLVRYSLVWFLRYDVHELLGITNAFQGTHFGLSECLDYKVLDLCFVELSFLIA